MYDVIVEDAVAVRVLTTADYSHSEIVSEEHQNRLMFWRDTLRIGQFDIGDIAREVILDAANRGIAVNNDRIDAAVGSFCGKTARTVRYYRETAAFFDETAREKYNMLPFSHFVFARTMGELWESVLERARLTPGMTAKALEAEFSGRGSASFYGEESAYLGTERDETLSLDHARTKKGSGFSPRIPRNYTVQMKLRALNAFAISIDGVISLVESSRVDNSTKTVMLDALECLKTYMPDVLKTMNS
jgi:hypothetical protein